MDLSCVYNEEDMNRNARVVLSKYFKSKGVEEGNEYLTYIGNFKSIKDFFINYLAAEGPYSHDIAQLVEDGVSNEWLITENLVQDYLLNYDVAASIDLKMAKALRRQNNTDDLTIVDFALSNGFFDKMSKSFDENMVKEFINTCVDYSEYETVFWDEFDKNRTPFLIFEDRTYFYIWERD